MNEQESAYLSWEDLRKAKDPKAYDPDALFSSVDYEEEDGTMGRLWYVSLGGRTDVEHRECWSARHQPGMLCVHKEGEPQWIKIKRIANSPS